MHLNIIDMKKFPWIYGNLLAAKASRLPTVGDSIGTPIVVDKHLMPRLDVHSDLKIYF